ncbi:MAG: type II toxin-antitoxin system HicA family toxin [Pyrinomonadaceae bacterium]
MRLPRNVSGADLIKGLRVFGYQISRQTGSHIRLTTSENGAHHVTIPNHSQIRVGTLAAILDDIANHLGINRQELLSKINL